MCGLVQLSGVAELKAMKFNGILALAICCLFLISIIVYPIDLTVSASSRIKHLIFICSGKSHF